MLESMRKYHQSIFIYVIFGLLILVFAVNFGPGSTGCSPNAGGDYAARVNGETITREEYARRYEQQVDQYRRMFDGRGGGLDESLLERFGVRQTVMDNLVGARLVAQEAKKRGVQISDDELYKQMSKAFGVDQVTTDRYAEWVQQNFAMSPDRFEQQIREEMAAQKLLAMVGDAVDISDAEVHATFVKEHDRAMATYVKFDPAADAPVIDDATAKAYAESNKDEVEARYKKDALMYNLPERRRVRQIVKSLASDASAEDVKKAEEAIAEVKKQLDGGADFATVAKASSDDEMSKANGGEIGLVGPGELARALDEKVKTLKAGETTKEAVRTPRGLYLLQVAEVVPSQSKAFDDVKVDVAKTVLAEKALDEATKKNAQAFLAKLQGGTSLESLTVAESEVRDATTAPTKPVRYDTPWILKGQDSIPRVGSSPELHSAIFALDPTASIAREAYKVNSSYYVVVYKDREKPDDTKFTATKDDLRKQALNEKRDRVVRDWMDNLRAKADVKVNEQLVPATKKA